MAPETAARPSPTASLVFERNLEVLAAQQPELAERVRAAGDDPALQVVAARTGHPVPVLRGKPLHSTEDPILEATTVARTALPDSLQQRLFFFGFGFGYHFFPLVEMGYSPIVVEPSLAMMKQALSHVDLRPILPFLYFHVGDVIPDIPRASRVVMMPALADVYPQQAARLSAKIIRDLPPKSDTMLHGIYYSAYRNVTCLKNPCDLAVYQMMLFMIRPTLIIEIGACRGGSALFFADILRMLGGDRRIHTYDIVPEVAPEVLRDPNTTYHLGGHASFDPSIIRPNDRVLVIEDSAHTYENTLEVLHKFAPYVSPNSYLIVEDGAAGATRPYLNGGPIRAIEEFMRDEKRFEVDQRWEYFYGSTSSNCLKGFLRRKP